MNPSNLDHQFSGSIPQLYEQLMVPMIFAPYATDMAQRARMHEAHTVLEIAAGTGAVTRELARQLPVHVAMTATDLNQAMIDHAASLPIARPVQWSQADAMQLPFSDASFDLVICQFGAMFFPDRVTAFSQVHRVLRQGGTFLFNTWDTIESNEFADEASRALAELYPDDPPRFMARTPHGYHQREQIMADLQRAGFTHAARIETVTARSHATSARIPALAFCQGTPLRNEIEARRTPSLEQATDHVTNALIRRFGTGPISGAIRAHVIAVTK